ncbi:MAG: hypothetical protein KBT49_04860 [Bacteroidetes bacterium]|nr:hypothetical protein [Candidatus Colenecus caballi]
MKRGILLLLTILATAGCEKNSYSTFSNKYRVIFSYSTQYEPFNQITSAGRFVSVRQVGSIIKTVDSDGNRKDYELTEIQSRSFVMGLAGLIIGTPTLNNDDMSVWAYDLGCPECDNGNRLTFNTTGKASCAKCGGIWDMNRSGFPENGKMRPLYRYPTYFSSSSITVQN